MKFGKKIVVGVASLAAVLGVAAAGSQVNADVAPSLPANTSTTKNDTQGSVSGQSNAHVDVEDGYLTLQDVPDMNFGVAADKSASTTIGIQGNNTGNNSNSLNVVDSRDATTGNNWNVTANLGDFNNQPTPDWAINLAPTKSTTGNGVMSNQATLNSGASNQSSIINATNKRGTTNIPYTREKDNASLTMPANVDANSYDAPITWTLNAQPSKDVTPGS